MKPQKFLLITGLAGLLFSFAGADNCSDSKKTVTDPDQAALYNCLEQAGFTPESLKKSKPNPPSPAHKTIYRKRRGNAFTHFKGETLNLNLPKDEKVTIQVKNNHDEILATVLDQTLLPGVHNLDPTKYLILDEKNSVSFLSVQVGPKVDVYKLFYPKSRIAKSLTEPAGPRNAVFTSAQSLPDSLMSGYKDYFTRKRAMAGKD